MEILSTGKTLKGQLLGLLVFVLVFIGNSVAHVADPSSWLSKHIIYGLEGITTKKVIIHDTNGVVGSGQDIGGANYNLVKMGGDVEVWRNFDLGKAGGNEYHGEVKVMGDIESGCEYNGASGTPCSKFFKDVTFAGAFANSANVEKAGGVNISKDASLTLFKEDFTTRYNYVVSGGTVSCSSAGGVWGGVGCPISGSPLSTILPAGSYDKITAANNDIRLGSGEYSIKTLALTGASIIVDTNLTEPLRILIENPIDFSWGTGAFGINAIASNYGKIIVYYSGTAAFSMPSGASNSFLWDATLFAPNATIRPGTNLEMHGQLLGKRIELGEDITLFQGSFVPFDPATITIANASAFSINENSDVSNIDFSNNTRLVEIPVELTAPVDFAASVTYTVRSSSASSKATLGASCLTGVDIAWGDSASGQSNTINFDANSLKPTNTSRLYLTICDDLEYEANTEYFEILLSNALPKDSVVLNDSVYQIPVISDDVANQSPTRVSSLADLILLEDFTAFDITTKLDTLFNDPNGDTLTYALVSSTSGWGAATVVSTTLEYGSIADSNGLDTIVVSASDGEFTVYDTLVVTVEAVNDAPDFDLGSNVSTAEESVYSQAWATNLSKGPSNESSQNLTFELLSISDSSLFSVLPIVSSSGVLSFSGAINKTGVATVSIRLKDDGGILNNGVDSSLTKTFTITLTNVNDDPVLDSTIQDVSLDEDFLDTLVYKNISSMVSDIDGDTVTAISLNVLGSVLESATVIGNDIQLESKLNANGFDSVEVLITISGVVLKDTFAVTVNAVNDDPTGLSLSQDSITENSSVGTEVGVFAITDVDNVTADFYFELDDSTYFSVVDNRLIVNSDLDYEALKALGKDTLVIQVTGTDKSDSSSQITQSFSIRVLDQNDSPYRNGSLEDLVFEEDFSDTIAIMQLDTLFTDPEGEDLRFSFEVKKDLSDLSDSANHVSFASKKDVFGVDTLIITATDPSSLSVSDTILINITAVNDDPVVKDTVGSVSENVNDGKTIVSLDVTDVDQDSIQYEILDSNSLFIVNDLGQIKLKDGVVLDFENLKADTLTVVVTDGISYDTSRVVINVLNEIEKSEIELIKIDDNVKVLEGVLDTIWSNQLDYVFTYTEAGVIVDSSVSISKNLETTGYGIQEVIRVFKDDTKELADTVVSYIVFNSNGPDIRIDTTVTKLPVDSNGIIYINNPDEEIKFIIDEVAKDPTKTVRVDTLVVGPLGEGQVKEWIVTYTDKYGNTSSDTIQVVLDTTPPVVEITKPSDNYLLTSLYAEVDWTVDGTLMKYDTTEILVEGFNVITRSYSDFAGNVGVDSVRVRVVIEGNKIEVELVNEIIKAERDDAKIEKYFNDRNREEPEDESWNLSYQIPDDDTQEFTGETGYIEAFYHDGGKKNEVTEEDQVPYTIDASDQIGISLSVDMHFPVIQPNGSGVNGEGAPKGVCEDGELMWDLGVDYMKVTIYDQLGQFVRTELITKFSVDSRFQNKEGIVNARFDLPSLEADLRASDGRKWAAGIYLLHVEVQTSAVGINCNEGEKEANRVGTMKRQGYSRN